MSTFEAPDLPRGTGVAAALAGTAGRGQARPATSSRCVISGPKSAHQAARAGQPLRDRRLMVGGMSTYPREALDSARDRHLAAVARSLGWARESAARGDYADALGWVRVVEAIGDAVPHEYEAKRQAWLSALAANRA